MILSQDRLQARPAEHLISSENLPEVPKTYSELLKNKPSLSKLVFFVEGPACLSKNSEDKMSDELDDRLDEQSGKMSNTDSDL